MSALWPKPFVMFLPHSSINPSMNYTLHEGSCDTSAVWSLSAVWVMSVPGVGNNLVMDVTPFINIISPFHIIKSIYKGQHTPQKVRISRNAKISKQTNLEKSN